MTDVEQVGGKNSSLGEMNSQLAGSGVRFPGGFATTAQAYRDFLAQSGLDASFAGQQETFLNIAAAFWPNPVIDSGSGKPFIHSLPRNHPAMLRRSLWAMSTSCGNDSLRNMIIVPNVGFTVAMMVLPVDSNNCNSPPSRACQSSFR